MKKVFFALLFGCLFLSFNCAQLTTGLERELTMRAETEREFGLWWKDIRQNPDKFTPDDRAFAERVFRIHRQTLSFPWEYVRRRFDDKNLPTAPTVADPTVSTAPAPTKIFTKDGDYWRWSDEHWWYFKEDIAGEHEMSRETVQDYLAAPDEKEKTLKSFGFIKK